ncbi:MAG: thiamine pyrophosphate-binding protein, partial [Bdellovibrionota bacterium]
MSLKDKQKDQYRLNSSEVDKKSRDLSSFSDRILKPYLDGREDMDVVADEMAARSLIPPQTAIKRSFASVASEFPKYTAEKCVACLECIVGCPDAAISAKVTREKDVIEALSKVVDAAAKEAVKSRFVKTTKYWNTYEKKGLTPGLFSLWIDPTKCKGCCECVKICGEHAALVMKPKEEMNMQLEEASSSFGAEILPTTSKEFINERLLVDLFLLDDAWVYKGGSGACKGCGEITALKMALTATAAKYGKDMVIVAATGCNSVFSSTYPYNIFSVPWTNPHIENAPSVA